MRYVAAVVLALGLLASAAPAELCTKCKDRGYTTDVGKCAACGGHTSSGAFKLCRKCSGKLRQCEHCRAKLPAPPKTKPAPAKPKPAPTTRPAKIDLTKPGTYVSGRWKYVLCNRPPGPVPFGGGGEVGILYYDGKPLPGPPHRKNYYVTPWGRMIHRTPRQTMRPPYGWVLAGKLRRGKELTPPAATTRPAKDMAAFLAALPVPRVDPTKEGSYTYTRGRWTYALSVKPGLRWGHLSYNRVAQRPVRHNGGIGNFFDTPWGRMYYHGEWRHPWGVQGWQLVPPRTVPRRPARLRLREWGHVRRRFLGGLETLHLRLQYHGPQDKPYYSLTLRVPVLKDERLPFWPAAQLTKAQAGKVIDHLAAEGFLNRAADVGSKRIVFPTGPAYTLTTYGGPKAAVLYEDLGWDLNMLGRLDGLRKVLDGYAAKAMDKLLARMAGHRKQWSKQATTRPAVLPAGRGK